MYKQDGSFSDSYMRQIGKRMEQTIRLAKRKKSEVAAEMGISRAAMTQYCKGDSTPTLSSMARFCTITKMPIDFIVYGVDPDIQKMIMPAMETALEAIEHKRHK